MPAPSIDMFLTSLEKDRLNNYQNELKRLADLNAVSLKWVAAYKVGLSRFQYGSGTTVVNPVTGGNLGYTGDDMELIEWNISEWQKRADQAKIEFDKLQAEANQFLDELKGRYGDQLNAAIKDYTTQINNTMTEQTTEATAQATEKKEEEKKPNWGMIAMIGGGVLLLILLLRK